MFGLSLGNGKKTARLLGSRVRREETLEAPGPRLIEAMVVKQMP